MRSTAPNAKLGRPAPRINGATIMWRRSRHPACMKRERVFAPPSTRTRRSPSSANATRMSAGENCPSTAGRDMVSTPSIRKAELPVLTTIVRPCSLHSRALCEAASAGRTTTRYRIRPANAAHSQLRIVSTCSLDPDNNGINQGSQAVKMLERSGAIDVMRAPRSSCHSAVE